ncbi:MAG: hypothetical protein WEG36_07515 [Gemmatimonadota bacterium]
MAVCETCGNDYHRSFEVTTVHGVHVFDSFECAIQKLAPLCARCGVRVVGHGVEAGPAIYCCAHCARKSGTTGIVDHLGILDHA